MIDRRDTHAQLLLWVAMLRMVKEDTAMHAMHHAAFRPQSLPSPITLL
jgi:hypothetical protein